MESSCKDNYNVSDAFTTLVEMTNIEYQKNKKINNFSLRKEMNANSRNKKACC